MSETTSTPRTDAMQGSGTNHVADALDFARQLERELNEAREQIESLAVWADNLMDHIDHPPSRNCSCHLSPPCGDCVEYSGLREAIAELKARTMAALKGDAQ